MGCRWSGRLIGVEGISGFCLRRWGGVFAFAAQAVPFGLFVFSLVFARWCLLRVPRQRVLAFALASVSAPTRRGPVRFFCLFAGIRAMPSCFKRRPCAGRHLLFFAAAKKSRQKKAANTANPCSYPRAG